MDRRIAIQIHYNEHIDEILTISAAVGFKYVSIALGTVEFFNVNNWEDEVKTIAERITQLDLKCIMTHTPYYNLLLSAEVLHEENEIALIRCTKATSMLDAKICTIHPRSVFIPGADDENCVDKQKSLEVNLENIAPIVQEAEKCGVLVGIENLQQYPNWRIPFYSCNVDDHIELIERLNSNSVCAVWDFGHSNLVDYDHADVIRKMGNRIKGTHVHDNDGIQDCHYPPFIPNPNADYVRRSVDWNSVIKALADTGFNGYLTLEPQYNYSYPIAPYIKLLYENTAVLEDMLIKYRA